MRVNDKYKARWVKSLREQYPNGTRVVLEYTNSDSIEVGAKGTVKNIFDNGAVLIDWDNGKTEAVIFELGDSIRKV